MQKYKILKGYARSDCRGIPDLCTFTMDLTKSGNIEWTYIEIKYPTCAGDTMGGEGIEMIDYNYDLERITQGSNVFYKTRKNFRSNTTKVYMDGVLMTPNDGSSNTYDYTEVGNSKIKFNFVFDYSITNITIEYMIL